MDEKKSLTVFFLLLVAFQIQPCLLNANQSTQKNADITSDQSKKLILFIHGYTGNQYKTWMSTNSKITWPQMFNEDKELNDLGFYSDRYGYESSDKSKNAPRINVLSRDLLDHLKRVSNIANDVDQIYIVAHSLGGLVAMDALSLAYRRKEDRASRAVFEKVKGIFLIASPLEGVAVRNVVKYFCKNKQILDVEGDRPYNEILNSDWSDIFRNNVTGTRPYIFTCYETEKTQIKKFKIIRVNRLIVPSNSLSPNRDEDPYEMTGKDHINIVKPISPNDRVYNWVKERLISTTLRLEFDDLKNAEGLDRYLNNIKIDYLRKYVASEDLREIRHLLRLFSNHLREKNRIALKDTVKRILRIMPTDPFFRVYKTLLAGRLFEDVFEGRFRVVQVVRWDWIVEGDEKAEVFVTTANEDGERVRFGPFTNNVISMLDSPLQDFIQILFQSSGTGRFTMYLSTFRIGWSVAERKEDGSWIPMIGFADYDPYFRIGLNGELED